MIELLFKVTKNNLKSSMANIEDFLDPETYNEFCDCAKTCIDIINTINDARE